MPKRKRSEKHFRDLADNATITYSTFPSSEIDSIMKDRLSGDVIMCKKKRKYPSNKVENPINKLPEELISSISSFLTMREAASMGILARWCWYLWRTYMKLNFDHRNMTGKINPTVKFRTPEFSVLQKKKCKFARWVHQILKLHCGPTIESFRMAYNLGEDHYSDIDQWVQFAINKGVQKLDIDLSPIIFPTTMTSIPYKFPHWLFTKGKHGTLKHLSLRSCSMDLPPSFGNFSSLASLTLKEATLTQERVQNILSNCSCLEWFSITLCDCPLLLKFWGGGPYLKLKHLNILDCDGIQEIEIHDAVDIASFEYMGPTKLDRLLFKNSAQIKRLCYGTELDPLACVSYALGHLPSDFPQLETLQLTFPRFKVSMIPKLLPTFSKLKELVLVFGGSHKKGLLGMTSTLLKVSPLLRKLVLHLPLQCLSRKVVRKKMPRVRHENLKEVEMYNFAGEPYEVRLAVYLLKSSTVLETIKIGCELRSYCGDGEWEITRIPFRITRKEAYGRLRRKVQRKVKVPSSVKLLVL